MEITPLIDEFDMNLSEKCYPIPENKLKIFFISLLIQSKLNHQAIETLAKQKLWSEAAALLRKQIDIRGRTLVLCSEHSDFAFAQLDWLEELQNRLRFLKLDYLEMESANLDRLLKAVKDQEGADLLRQWFSQKPSPRGTIDAWLRNWYLWSVERLLFEVDKNLVESPRTRKELQNLAEFARDQKTSIDWRGVKRYVHLDGELNLVEFNRNGQIDWPQGPVGISSACILDLLSDINDFYELGLEKKIEAYRGDLNH